MTAVNHDQLVALGAKRLASKGCYIVVTEMTTREPESPDVLAWGPRGTHLIECKTSRSDFSADKRKTFRRMSEFGMGRYRWYLAPEGVLTPKDMPYNWGLLVLTARGIREELQAHPFGEHNLRAEMSVLESCLRRIGQSPPPGVSIKCYTVDTKRTATLGVAEEEV